MTINQKSSNKMISSFVFILVMYAIITKQNPDCFQTYFTVTIVLEMSFYLQYLSNNTDRTEFATRRENAGNNNIKMRLPSLYKKNSSNYPQLSYNHLPFSSFNVFVMF